MNIDTYSTVDGTISRAKKASILQLRWRRPITLTRPKGIRDRDLRKKPKDEDHAPNANARLSNASTALRKSPSAENDRLGPLPSIALLVDSRSKRYISQWWFYSPNDSRQPSFTIAKRHWVEAGWDIALNNKIFFECISLYTQRKLADLSSGVAHYLHQKGRLIQCINKDITQAGSQSRPISHFTLVAIGVIAYCCLLDKQFEAARLHLTALRSIQFKRRFERSKEDWLYVVWVDLRYALIHSCHPLLEYFVPQAYRGRPNFDEDNSEFWEAASTASCSCPIESKGIVFNRAVAFDLCLKVFRLTAIRLNAAPASRPLFGALYDIEYHLRVVHSRISAEYGRSQKTESNRVLACVEIFVASIQVHIWVLCRHWAPVSPGSRQVHVSKVNKALEQFGSTDSLIATWYYSGGDKASITWSLVMLLAFALQDQLPLSILAMQTLSKLFTAGQTTLSELKPSEGQSLCPRIIELRAWPWTDDWHTPKFVRLVEGLRSSRGCESVIFAPKSDLPRFYLGAVEFYDS